MSYVLNRNGSFDIIGSEVCLCGCYPALDEASLRPIGVAVGEGDIRYTLDGGELTLRFGERDGVISIDAEVVGLDNARSISVISGATSYGAKRLFRQGFGIGGPSGFVGLENAESISSDALIVLDPINKPCFTLFFEDNRRFRNVFGINTVKSHSGDKQRFSATVMTEAAAVGSVLLPTLYITEATSVDSALRLCASRIASFMGARTPKAPAYHWCSWYYLYHNLNQSLLEEYLAGFTREEAGFKYIQIDAGYFTSCGDWLKANHNFPLGMKHAADTIIKAGYLPGIWIAPYMVGDQSDIYKNHRDWLLHTVDGGLVNPWKQYNEPKVWGYVDSDYYVLDISNPDAMDYIVGVFKQYHDWGYRLYKTDFLLWGLHDSTTVARFKPGKTSFEYFRSLMVRIREAIGEESAWLGCIAPFMPSLGYVDMMRIGGDVGASWKGAQFGPENMLNETTADNYFNNVYWQNDPDAVLLRNFHIYLNYTEVETLALVQALSGGVITTSAPLHLLSADRKKLLKLIKPSYIPKVSFPEGEGDELIIVSDTDYGKLVYFANPTEKPVTLLCDLEKLAPCLPFVRRLHGGEEPSKLFPLALAPHSCALYFVTGERLEKEPENLWII